MPVHHFGIIRYIILPPLPLLFKFLMTFFYLEERITTSSVSCIEKSAEMVRYRGTLHSQSSCSQHWVN